MESHGLFEEHGGIDRRELESMGISPGQVTDFSVNSNPFGPAPGVYKALRSVDVSAYPDRSSARLRELLAELNHVPLRAYHDRKRDNRADLDDRPGIPQAR